jgi:hypothetical protein
MCVEPCCSKECFLSSGYEYGVAVAKACLSEMEVLGREERKDYMLEKVRSCVLGTTKKGYLQLRFSVGVAPGPHLHGVCRRSFCTAYGVGHSYIDNLCITIKAGHRNAAPELGDTTPSIAQAFLKNLVALAKSLNIQLTPLQLGALMVPNTVEALSCFAWMHSYFDTVGDKQPVGGVDCGTEIHIEPIAILRVHSEYLLNISDAGEKTLSYTSFLSMWKNCFPHVKIREYKAVSGKCKTCAILSEARRKHLSRDARRYLTQLHSFHRTMYMGERQSYYARRNDAMLMPADYWSGIGDGMMQSHCQLPHRGNMVQFPSTLPQHLQGILAHGRSMEIYRTFHNVSNGCNLSLHCLLLALEKVKLEKGRIPDVVYYQIDGGSENTGRAVLGICELIVARGLAKKVVLTRLPVGHTHEDIDSKFALIWKRVRNQFVLTPAQYADLIERALTTEKLTCSVHNIFVVPDYVTYITPFVDPNLAK